MLVVSRRIGEQILIGENIRITVVGVHGKQVRLGVSAPPTVVVDRQEIRERRFPAQEQARPQWGRCTSPQHDHSLAPVN